MAGACSLVMGIRRSRSVRSVSASVVGNGGSAIGNMLRILTIGLGLRLCGRALQRSPPAACSLSRLTIAKRLTIRPSIWILIAEWLLYCRANA
jgi:hypothetical protein